MSSKNSIPLPSPLKLKSSEISSSWKRFKSQWANYELATDLSGEPKEKRTAVLLTCIGNEAYDVFQSMVFADEAHRNDIDQVIRAFDDYCIGETNITYERYILNKRVQEPNEPFDSFMTELRRLIKSCDYGMLEESIIKDRIVIGINDDSTRRKLLQLRKLDLAAAIDVCRASETANRYLREIKNPEEVHRISRGSVSKKPKSGVTSRQRGKSWDRTKSRSTGREETTNQGKCRYCSTVHEFKKELCKAYGKTCNKCHQKNHFAASRVCKGKIHNESNQACNMLMTDDHDSGSDQIFALTSNKLQEVKRKLFASLKLGESTIRFLLDCGATVNLLSEEIAKKALGSQYKIRPAQSNLRMYDKSELKTVGMITATVINPKTNKQHAVDFYITKNHNDPILGSEACQRLKFLTVNLERILALDDIKRVTVKTQEDVNKQFSDLFQGIGKLEGKLYLVVDPSVPAVCVPLRKLPVPIKEKVRTELLSMVESGIIEPVNEPSEWISALVVVAKANGGIRLCVDTKPLNKALKRNHYLMPTLEDILPELQDAKVFTTCDVSKAFYHVQLDDESKKLTTFESPFGRFRFLRMAFGLSVSPEEWMRRLHEVLYGLKGVACIADDILVNGSGKTLEEANADHDENLTELFNRCRERGIHFNKEKFKYKRDSVAYMSHELTRNVLQIYMNKVKAIREMPAPVDKKGVQRLLGVATYLSRYAPVFSQQTATLRSLLESKNEFRWDEEIHGKAFEQLKLTFENAPVLSYFDVNKEITVQCDASQNGLGACLLQEGKPIVFVSRALSASEKSYAQIEKELLGIVFAMERFHTYVFGSSIKIETDHKPLLTIVKKALTSAPKRLQRMLLRLQNYDFELIYRPGTQLVLADTLSRAYLPRADTRGSASELFSEDIAALQDEDKNDYIVASEYVQDLIKKAIETDDHYKALKHQIHTGWPERAKNVSKELQQYLPYCDELIVENGLIFKGTSLFVPQAIRQEMVERAHMSHAGINSSIRRARDAVYWPKMNAEITKHISKCEICQRIASESQKEPMILRELATRPWQFVATDLFEFRQQSYLITA